MREPLENTAALAILVAVFCVSKLRDLGLARLCLAGASPQLYSVWRLMEATKIRDPVIVPSVPALCVMLRYKNARPLNSFPVTSVLLADMACGFLLPENLCYALCCLQKLILKIEKQKLFFTAQPDSTRPSILSAETARLPRRTPAARSAGAAGRPASLFCHLACGTGRDRRVTTWPRPMKRN